MLGDGDARIVGFLGSFRAEQVLLCLEHGVVFALVNLLVLHRHLDPEGLLGRLDVDELAADDRCLPPVHRLLVVGLLVGRLLVVGLLVGRLLVIGLFVVGLFVVGLLVGVLLCSVL